MKTGKPLTNCKFLKPVANTIPAISHIDCIAAKGTEHNWKASPPKMTGKLEARTRRCQPTEMKRQENIQKWNRKQFEIKGNFACCV